MNVIIYPWSLHAYELNPMTTSVDDEVAPLCVTNYYFQDQHGEPVTFAVLPVVFHGEGIPDAASAGQVFLRGTAVSSHEKVFKLVSAWRLGFGDEQPEISVLSKCGLWIRLLKPIRAYQEGLARTILVTVHMLQFLRRKPGSSENTLFVHLSRVLSFEPKPAMIDFQDHLTLIMKFFKRDEVLANNCLLSGMFLESTKKIISEGIQNESVAKNTFIANSGADEALGDDDSYDSEEESELFDSVCAICDNGGNILCCEGRCLRSFHATREAGFESNCKTLGFSRSKVEEITNFLCKNCQAKQHQCYICGMLGSSDKSVGAEVFPCVNATCGHFYHPKCVARLLFRGNEAEATECQKKIAAGDSFMCPAHRCVVCNKGENKRVKELQFAMCRRCPKSYHRQCLPRKIAFRDVVEEGIKRRAWDGLLSRRILIYCLKHEINEFLRTPIRNHLRFPEIFEKTKLVEMQKGKSEILIQKKFENSDSLPLKKRNLDFDRLPKNRTPVKSKNMDAKRVFSVEGASLIKSNRNPTEQLPVSKRKMKYLKDIPEAIPRKLDGAVPMGNEITKYSAFTVRPTTSTYKTSFPVIREETVKKMKALWDEVCSSVTLDDIMRKHKMPSTHASSGWHIDKIITQGKIEGSIEAVRSAINTLEDGGSIEDAKAVCEPEVLKNLWRWSSKLRVYLSPFLHGSRYTSFGRHFTKVNKLKEIVDKLQWYVQDGDMLVDFCCGANDFSQLMMETLDESGRNCLFKNFDIIQPKNDFCFEKRDWMTVEPEELPAGSQLIMGLNPPFGVNAALANMFIDKALSFKPKLIILIVPPCTQRLDRKRPPYDLIWEDFRKLAGKSFYLPGSVDLEEKQMDQWNHTAPVLYLWSRQDWTPHHRRIALKQGHTSNNSPFERSPPERIIKEHTIERHDTIRESQNSYRRSHKRTRGYSMEESCQRRKIERAEEVEEGELLDISPPTDDWYWGLSRGRYVRKRPLKYSMRSQENMPSQRNRFCVSRWGWDPTVLAQQGQLPADRRTWNTCPPYSTGFAQWPDPEPLGQMGHSLRPYPGPPGFAQQSSPAPLDQLEQLEQYSGSYPGPPGFARQSSPTSLYQLEHYSGPYPGPPGIDPPPMDQLEHYSASFPEPPSLAPQSEPAPLDQLKQYSTAYTGPPGFPPQSSPTPLTQVEHNSGPYPGPPGFALLSSPTPLDPMEHNSRPYLGPPGFAPQSEPALSDQLVQNSTPYAGPTGFALLSSPTPLDPMEHNSGPYLGPPSFAPQSEPALSDQLVQNSTPYAGPTGFALLSSPTPLDQMEHNPGRYLGPPGFAPQSEPALPDQLVQNSTPYAGPTGFALLSSPTPLDQMEHDSGPYLGPPGFAPQSEPALPEQLVQNSTPYAGSIGFALLSSPTPLGHMKHKSGPYLGPSGFAPQTEPALPDQLAQNPTPYAGPSCFAPQSEPALMDQLGQNSTPYAGPPGFAPKSEPALMDQLGQNSTPYAGLSGFAPQSESALPNQNSAPYAGPPGFTLLSSPTPLDQVEHYLEAYAGPSGFAPKSETKPLEQLGQYSTPSTGPPGFAPKSEPALLDQLDQKSTPYTRPPGFAPQSALLNQIVQNPTSYAEPPGFAPQSKPAPLDHQAQSSTPYLGPPGFETATSTMQLNETRAGNLALEDTTLDSTGSALEAQQAGTRGGSSDPIDE